MSMTQHAKRRVLYVKKETTAGTYVGSTTLFATTNAVIPPDSIKFNPKPSITQRNPEGNSLQGTKAVVGAKEAEISFSSRYFGPASKGVAGALSDLFAACFEKEVLVAGTSATSIADPNSQTRLSIGVGSIQEDGLLEVEWAIAGAAGDYTLKADKIGDPVMVDWKFAGKIAYEAGALVALDDATPQAAITWVDDDALGFTFMGLTVTTGLLAREFNKFEFSRGVKVEMETSTTDKAGRGYAKISADDPSLKIDPSKVPVATANDLLALMTGATSSAGLTLTNAAGATASFAFPNLQIEAMSDDARDAVSTWGITAKCKKSQTSQTSDAYTRVFA